MNILSRITTGLSIAIFAACCLVFLLFGLTGTGWKALTIPTGSMRPGMPPGSLALVHRVPDNSLKVGDVITYVNPLRPKTTITHRIIKKTLIDGVIPGFVSKGDANKVADMPFVAGAVEGKVIWHSPYLGSWVSWGKSWTGIAVLVYAPAMLVVIEEILRINSYYKSLIPYRLFGYKFEPKIKSVGVNNKLALGSSVALIIIFVSGIVAPAAEALLTTNTVALTHNRISVAPSGGTNQCSGNNSNNVHINNSTTQSASSGNATVSGNTSGGSATSGNASNNNSTTINISVTNC